MTGSRPLWSTLPLWLTPLSGNQDSTCHTNTGQKINHFWTNQGHCAFCHKSGTCSVANVNVSYRQQLHAEQIAPNCRVAYRSFTWLKMPLLNVWCHTAHNANDNNNNNNLLTHKCHKIAWFSLPTIAVLMVISRRTWLPSSLGFLRSFVPGKDSGGKVSHIFTGHMPFLTILTVTTYVTSRI